MKLPTDERARKGRSHKRTNRDETHLFKLPDGSNGKLNKNMEKSKVVKDEKMSGKRQQFSTNFLSHRQPLTLSGECT